MPEYLVELYSVADPDSAALAGLGDGTGRPLPALDRDPGRRDLPAPRRRRLHRAGREGMRAGRPAGGPDRGGRRPTGADDEGQGKGTDMKKRSRAQRHSGQGDGGLAPGHPRHGNARAASSAATNARRRAATLHLTKECSAYTGLADPDCTITSSNVQAIPVGSRVVVSPGRGRDLAESDIVVVVGRGNYALGHVTLDLATGTGRVTLSGRQRALPLVPREGRRLAAGRGQLRLGREVPLPPTLTRLRGSNHVGFHVSPRGPRP